MADFKDGRNGSLQEKTLIEEEISSLKRLLELAEQKRDALLQEDLDTLMSLLQAEEGELKVLEGIRRPDGCPVVKAEHRSESDSTSDSILHDLLEERKRIARKVKDLNEFNQQLIGDSLAYIHFMLQIFHGEDGKSIYGAKGIMETKTAGPLIDLKG
ncbi:MAG TPA: flagellar protein FlgN [Firmicutes bacterium]|nr:flagellar protein FlgN [Bacillota bacterium]